MTQLCIPYSEFSILNQEFSILNFRSINELPILVPPPHLLVALATLGEAML